MTKSIFFLLLVINFVNLSGQDTLGIGLPFARGDFHVFDAKGEIVAFDSSNYVLILGQEVYDPNGRLRKYFDYIEKWQGKRLVVKSCLVDDNGYYFSSHEELVWNKHCYTPLAERFILKDSIPRVELYEVSIDSLDNYKPIFSHRMKGYVFMEIPEKDEN